MHKRETRLFCLLAGLWLWAAPAAATDIYVYEDSDGSRLITDHPRMEPGYRLVRVYSGSGVYRSAGASTLPVARPRPSSFDDLIVSVARRSSLDPLLIKSVMHAESAFDPDAVSKKGASGLMQLMPDTAARYGVNRIFDPTENVLGGARYLSDLLDLFDGDVRLALAGYNAGENAVLERGGVPPYSETRRYISKVMQLYRAYQDQRCRQREKDMSVIEGTIVSCSGAAGSHGISSVSNLSAQSESTLAREPAANTVSSADEGGWRVTE